MHKSRSNGNHAGMRSLQSWVESWGEGDREPALHWSFFHPIRGSIPPYTSPLSQNRNGFSPWAFLFQLDCCRINEQLVSGKKLVQHAKFHALVFRLSIIPSRDDLSGWTMTWLPKPNKKRKKNVDCQLNAKSSPTSELNIVARCAFPNICYPVVFKKYYIVWKHFINKSRNFNL